MQSPNPEFSRSTAAESLLRRRKIAVCAAVLSLLAGNASAALLKNPRDEDRTTPNALSGTSLYEAYPDFRVAENYYLNGINLDIPGYDPARPQATARAVLRFQSEGNGIFKQYNNDPAAPNSDCHWDQLDWQPGAAGALEYTETYNGCGSVVQAFIYNPGIKFMPRFWRPGQKWSANTISNSSYYENGIKVCQGLNVSHSYVAGLKTLPGAGSTVHTHTTEIQSWLPVFNAPYSSLCPSYLTGSYKWQENFYLSDSIAVMASNGTVTGYQPGLARSLGGLGGNTTKSANNVNWDVWFSSWKPMPQPTVPTVSPSSTG
jgi:hypothetical protein